ncbi:hypothetical protein [Tenacibaculum holothuriorum]|uniref:hypothetical protein n=1 Tax=Tenacibaculum holothuriorum TaxID=1635173 RepID=UPI00117F7C91|nr:hypothetical protein [Tenacibaculum holothuriorum]
MKKVLPFIYIAIGIFILVGTFSMFFQDRETYRVLLNFKTENKYIFLIVRLLFASWFLVDGVKKLKQNQAED